MPQITAATQRRGQSAPSSQSLNPRIPQSLLAQRPNNEGCQIGGARDEIVGTLRIEAPNGHFYPDYDHAASGKRPREGAGRYELRYFVTSSLRHFVTLRENPRNATGGPAGHGAGQHGSRAEADEIGSAIGGEQADAADLDADRAEIREAADRIRRDHD